MSKKVLLKEGTTIQTLSDVDCLGNLTVRTGKILKGGKVLLSDGTITTIEAITTFLTNPKYEICLWAEYNPEIKRWQKINNIKIISK